VETALLGILLLAQLAAVGWKHSSLRRFLSPDRSTTTDLILFAANAVGLAGYLGIVCSLGLVWIIQKALPVHGSRLAAFSSGNAIADFLLYLLATHFIDYWNHRFWHSRFGWPAHRLHHSATYFSPLLAWRIHPIQLLSQAWVPILPLMLMGILPLTLGAVALLNTFLSMLVHVDANWDWGWFGRWIVCEPRFHRIHHSPLSEHADKNFSVIPLFDHIFGTWYSGEVKAEAIGISEPIHNRRAFWREIIADTLDLLRCSKLARSFR